MDAKQIVEKYLNENEFETIKGYETYKINKQGEIWSLISLKKLKIYEKEEEKYYYVVLYNNSIRKKCYIHRLLALQYIENTNPEEFIEVDHIDRNRQNNSLDNLRWVNKSIQNNNKCNCIALKTEEEQEQRKINIKEYKKQWAEKNRREKGVEPKKIGFDNKEYQREWMAKKRASLTEEEKKKELEHRRKLYAQKEQTEEQKEAAKERAKKQREEIKADPEKLAQQREYKRLKAKEYREKKKQEQQS